MKTPLTLVTSKEEKARQVQQFLSYPVEHHDVDLTEIQETDPHKVTAHKVTEAFLKLRKPVIVDDNSLIITYMGQLPGTFIKWFEKELGFEKICRLADVDPMRKAIAVVQIGYSDGKTTEIFTGKIFGSIAMHPAGTEGFGWDVIFIPEGYTITRAQMHETDYEKTSPRKIALEKLKKFLTAEV